MDHYVIYQAYGNVAILTEVVLSILSIKAKVNIVIYTDQPEWFAAYPWLEHVIFVPVDKKQLTDWAGPQQFVHRVKIKILEDATSRFEGRLLYLDTDTLLTADIEILFDQINDQQVLMHCDEGSLANSSLKLNRRLGSFLAGRQLKVADQTIEIPTTTRMYNAGVIGLTSNNAKKLIPKVLALSDVLYHAWSKHTMEQLAFSYYLGQIGVKDTSKEVLHYWKLKPLRQQLIGFVRAYQQQPKEAMAQAFFARFDFPNLVEKQTTWDNLPSIWRKFLTAIGRGWDLTKI